MLLMLMLKRGMGEYSPLFSSFSHREQHTL